MVDHNFHQKSGTKTLKELADIVGAEIVNGQDDHMVSDVSPLATATDKDISFLDNAKYIEKFKQTKAGACIVSSDMVESAPDGCQLLVTKSPYKAYALIAQAFYPAEKPTGDISPQAHIDPSAKIGEGATIAAGVVVEANAVIGAGCYIEGNVVIGTNVQIGDGCHVGANTSVSHAIIGQHTRLYPGVRIGQDGFGFAIDPAGHVKVPQLGRVIIGDHVEIGANSCVDRGAGPDTEIGNGVWLDNLVQIGHNVKIGQGSVIVAQAGIAGSTELENYVVVAAQAGITGHLKIGQGTRIAGKTGVMQSLPAGSEVMGYPALPIKQFLRQVAMLKKMVKSGK